MSTINPLIVLDTNKSFEEFTQVPKIEAIGAEAVVFFADHEKFLAAQEKVLKGDQMRGEEMILLAHDHPVYVSAHLASRRGREGDMIGYFLGIFDISEFKKLQQSLEQKVEERTHELKEKLDELEKFYRLTVGRELKMIELKKAIRSVKPGPDNPAGKNISS